METQCQSRQKYLLIFLLFLAIEFFIAIFVKDKFIRPYVGDVLVVFVLYFFIKICTLDKIKYLSIYIFIFSVFTEFLQAINIIDILGLANIKFFRILIGTTFDFKDIFCYFLGSIFLFYLDFKRRKNGIYTKRRKNNNEKF